MTFELTHRLAIRATFKAGIEPKVRVWMVQLIMLRQVDHVLEHFRAHDAAEFDVFVVFVGHVIDIAAQVANVLEGRRAQ